MIFWACVIAILWIVVGLLTLALFYNCVCKRSDCVRVALLWPVTWALVVATGISEIRYNCGLPPRRY